MNLIRASAKGDLAAVKKLVNEGADVNDTDAGGRSPLLEAAWGGYNDVVKFLIDRGAKVNSADTSGFTPLMRAVEEGHATIVAALIKRRADVNTRGNVRGVTPLMLAAEKGDVKIIDMLLSHGAKINAMDQFEETALAHAYRAEQLKAITFLESKGAIRKPERPMLVHHDKELRPFTKASIPQWSAAADDAGLEGEESAPEEPFEEEQ
ncbi:MAG: ankyrin repeat domain-containing protein [Chitinispirillaceae bacterium]|nr:ankyrin repeat domain-containing protein [Chitinispirillaceae bacterium]